MVIRFCTMLVTQKEIQFWAMCRYMLEPDLVWNRTHP